MSELLANRTAVVTGASRGIGRATADALAEAGARVIGLSRTGVVGTRVTGLAIDLLDASAATRVVEAVDRELGAAPDVLINNAGLFQLAPLATTEPVEFDRLLALNLALPFRLIRAFLPRMLARGQGHIVTIGSIADHVAFPANGAYSASKFGLRGLHEVLRTEVGGSGVRATLVSPGAVDTDVWDALPAAMRSAFPPRARMLAAADIADAVMFALTRSRRVSIDEIRLSTG
jgi:NAD(P)-dependent dehydrogenase (short-subunit alcohol dehydrogenase family)